MLVENYRFLCIGGIVSVLFVCLLSLKIIIIILILVCIAFGVWNFRNKIGIQRRLLQSGLRLGLTNKSNRGSRHVSNLNSKFKSSDLTNNNSSETELSADNLVRRKIERPKLSDNERTKTCAKFGAPNSTFVSPRSFNFGSPRIATSFGASLLSSATPLLHGRDLSVTPEDVERSTWGSSYNFQPRRILSINRRYPTHQPNYGHLGAFPSIHLRQNPTPLLSSPSGQHTAVTVRIAPPQNFSPSPIKLSFTPSPTPKKVEQDPCDARTVVAALKENSRKRSRREEALDWDTGKRQRYDSSTNSSGSLSASVMGDGNPMEEGDRLDGADGAPLGTNASSKRPATPGPAQAMVLKRHKNDAILSSYSSFKRTAKQSSDVSPPTKKLVKISSSGKDRFCQTENEHQASGSPGVSNTSQDPDILQVQSSADTALEVKRSPFPALKEGFSPRQNIPFYADIGKTSKFVYTMPDYLPTIADYQHDKQIEQQRLNHLMFGKRKALDFATSKCIKDVIDNSSVDSSKKIGLFSDFGKEQSESSLPIASTSTLMSNTPSGLTMFNNIATPNTALNFTSSKLQENASNGSAPPLLLSSESVTATSITSANFFAKPTTIASGLSSSTSGFMPKIQTSNNSNSEIADNTEQTTSKEGLFASHASPSTTNSVFFKPPTPVSSNTSNLVQSTSFSPESSGAMFGASLNTTNDKNSVTTLTTATTTQTSIPTLSLFTSSASTPLSTSNSFSGNFAPPQTSASSNGTQSFFETLLTSMATPSNTTSISQSESKPDTPVNTGTAFGIQSKPVNVSVTASPSVNPSLTFSQTSSVPVFSSSVQVKPVSTLSSQPNSTFGTTTTTNIPFSDTFQTSSSLSQGKITATSTQPINSFTPAATPSINFSSTTQPSSIFNVSTLPNSTFAVSTQPVNVFSGTPSPKAYLPGPIAGLFTTMQPTNNFGATPQPTNTFGATSNPTNAFGPPSQLTRTFGVATQSTTMTSGITQSSNTFGVPTQASNAFGTTTQPTNTFGTSTLPSSGFGVQSANAFGSPAPSANTFGASTQPANAFGTSAPSTIVFGTPISSTSTFGTSTQPSTTFGVSKAQTNSFGTPTQPTNSFGVASQAANTFGTLTQPANTFGSSTQPQSNIFGQPGSNSNVFGVSLPAGNSTFGTPSTQGNAFGSTQASLNFGTPSLTNTAFGVASQPATSFNGLPTQTNTFGSLSSADLFGATPNKPNSVSDAKPTFGIAPNNLAFGSSAFGTQQPMSQPQFGSFGGSGGNSTMSFASSGQPNAFDPAKSLGIGSAASVFSSPSAGSNEASAGLSFNTAPASGLNFNFNSKPNFNFGPTTEAPAFGSSQTFVFTGAPNPGPMNNSTGTPNSFFSIGAGARERKLTAARKRVTRK